MRALILIDIQNDFLPGGALAVAHGDEIIDVANRVQTRFELVVATRDLHPAGHKSFASSHPGKKVGQTVNVGGIEQTLWPDHCVQGTHGSKLAAALDSDPIERVFFKGSDASIDSYSAFFDNDHRKSTGLSEWLKERKVTEVWLMGLATDWCVKASALDARKLGLDTVVIEDGCRPVELKPGDSERAIAEMKAAGVRIAKSTEV